MAVMGRVHDDDGDHEVWISVYGGSLCEHGVVHVDLCSSARTFARFSLGNVSELKFLIADLKHALKQAPHVRARPRVAVDDSVRSALDGVGVTTTADLCGRMGWPDDTAGLMHAGAVLHSLGFAKRRKRIGGTLSWVWVRG